VQGKVRVSRYGGEYAATPVLLAQRVTIVTCSKPTRSYLSVLKCLQGPLQPLQPTPWCLTPHMK